MNKTFYIVGVITSPKYLLPIMPEGFTTITKPQLYPIMPEGFITETRILDQKRLKEPLYRHPTEDILYLAGGREQ